jgi:hypothetical protein
LVVYRFHLRNVCQQFTDARTQGGVGHRAGHTEGTVCADVELQAGGVDAGIAQGHTRAFDRISGALVATQCFFQGIQKTHGRRLKAAM